MSEIIVFKPGLVAGPVQDLSFGFWPGHRVGQVNLYFKKNSKRCRFSKTKNKKTKVNELQTGFWPGFAGSIRQVGRVIPDRDFFYFFFNPTRVDPSGRARFQNYEWNYFLDKKRGMDFT